ncbi:MAG: hypothetical protein E5X48_33150 [Mesorhizobium sp.]|nr:MAG: hypothetical protein E5X48_33150 [Mesorhizobium sp.]
MQRQVGAAASLRHVSVSVDAGFLDGILAGICKAVELPISPLVGEMPGRAEGGAVPPAFQFSGCLTSSVGIRRRAKTDKPRSFAPPSVLPDQWGRWLTATPAT